MRKRTAAGAACLVLAAAAGLVLLPGGDPPGPPPPAPRRTASAPPPAPRAPAAPGPPLPAEPDPAEAPGEEDAAGEPPAPRRRVALEGRVVGLRDEGVEGASVAVFTGPDLRGEDVATLEDLVRTGSVRRAFPAKTAVTDGDGGFRIEFEPLAFASVVAEAEGWTPARLENLNLLEDRRDLLLRLGASAPVEGVVLEATPEGRPGGPVEGAAVTLLESQSAIGKRSGGPERRVVASAKSGAEGRFVLHGATPGPCAVLVTAPGRTAVLQDPVPAPARDLRILLPAALYGDLRGTVLLPGAGDPAAGVEVRAWTSPRRSPVPSFAEATTDGAGRFRIRGLEVEPGESGTSLTVEVRVERRGYAWLQRRDWPGDSDERMALRAWPDGRLEGRVTASAAGGVPFPVKGIRVRAAAPWQPDPDWPPIPVGGEAFSRADGSWAIAGLCEGTRKAPLAVGVETGRTGCTVPEGYDPHPPPRPASGPWVHDIALLAPEGPAAEARAGRGGGAAARARGADPPGDDLVVLRGVVAGPEGEAVPGAAVSGWGRGAVLADRAGLFELRGPMGPGANRATLRAEAPGYAPGSLGPFDIVAPGEIRGMEIPLRARLVPLLGRVVDAGGKPAGGVLVVRDLPGRAPRLLSSWQYASGVTVTRPDGTFRFEVPGRSTWSLAAREADGGEGVLDPVTAGEAIPDLVLAPAGSRGRR